MDALKTVLGEALEKINLSDVIVDDSLPNGLTRTIVANLKFTEHAIKRIRERMDLHTRNVAEATIRDYLINADFVGTVIAEDGNESLCYVHNRIGIYLEPTKQRVITVYDYEVGQFEYLINHMDDIKKAVIEVQKKKMKQLNQKHRRIARKAVENKYDFAVEIAELDRKIFKTKSDKVREKYQKRKDELVSLMEEEHKSVLAIEKDMRMLSKGICAVSM